MKNKKVLIFIIALVILTVIGTTLAYYSNTVDFRNLFKAAVYQNEVTEVFNSPDDWTPGDETPKTLVVKNTGQVCENVRISYTEKWEDKNGNELPLKKNNESVAIINFDNQSDWTKKGKYYYYNNDLLEGQSTSSFIKSVTYNPNTVGDLTCTTEDSVQNCTTQNENDESEYTLTLKIETVQCDAKDEMWPPLQGTLMVHDSNISQTFGKSISRDLFESIEIVDNLDVPDTAIDSWDVSEEQNESIVAWYTDTDNNGLYELFIGGENKVVANPNSSHTFDRFTNVTMINLEKLDTSNVTNMLAMLQYLNNVTSLDLSNFNTSNVTNMAFMIYNNIKLNTLDVSSFDTSNVTDMSYMFNNCNRLTTLDLSNFNTSNVTDMGSMFSECSGLTSLDLSNFNTSSVTNMSSMVRSCSSLTTIYISNNFDTSNVSNSSRMFYNCTNLVGGNGTTYNSSYIDKTYARIDTASTPGYFTAKN